MTTRILVGLAGGIMVAYGAVLLAGRDLADLAGTAIWLAGGVLAHDALVAPATILVAALAARALPEPWRAPAAAALVVLGSVTLVAIPVLGRFGAQPDNPTLLDRPYWTGWAGFATLVLAAAAAAGALRAARGRGGGEGGEGPGRRRRPHRP